MKKALLAFVALVSIGFTSCKKDWTCTCTEGTTTVDYTISNLRRPEASTICTTYERTAGVSCKLK